MSGLIRGPFVSVFFHWYGLCCQHTEDKERGPVLIALALLGENPPLDIVMTWPVDRQSEEYLKAVRYSVLIRSKVQAAIRADIKDGGRRDGSVVAYAECCVRRLADGLLSNFLGYGESEVLATIA